MVTGWRRAFCTSIPKDKHPKVSTDKQQQHCDENNNNNNTRSPKISSKFGFFSSNPSTPRLQQSHPVSSPSLRCKTRTPNSSLPNSPKLQCHVTKSTPNSNPSSPKSPSTFSLLKLRILSKTRCGICLESVKPGQGTAIFTAECSHSFHFPCIASHVKTTHQTLLCPICSAQWKELPLLSIKHKHNPKPTKTLRVYDDDEPLMSPTSGARFNPIPETEDEEEQEQFRGFFKDRVGVEVKLVPESTIIATARGYETRAVVMKVKATSIGTRRAPIDVVIVIDVALKESISVAKRAMRIIAAYLGPNDRLSIVAFSASSKRLLPLRRATTSGKRSARRIADALGQVTVSPGQGISVSDAVKKAAKVLEDRREKNPAAAIILISDQSKPISISRFTSSNLDVPIHALGFDDDVDRVRDLLAVVVRDLRVELAPARGSPAEIAAVYSLTHRPAVMDFRGFSVGDLHSDEEREFLVEVRVATSASCGLTVRSSYVEAEADVAVHRESNVAIRLGNGNQRLRSLHVATRAMAESKRMVENGDLIGAKHMLSSARALLIQSKSASAEEFARGLEAEMVELSRVMCHVARRSRVDEKAEPLTPTSAWRAAERLAKVAIMRKSMNRVSDLHGFENARF